MYTVITTPSLGATCVEDDDVERLHALLGKDYSRVNWRRQRKVAVAVVVDISLWSRDITAW